MAVILHVEVGLRKVDMSSRWSDATGGTDAAGYTERFERLAAAGHDVHGEATLCASLVASGARILDAGCGTGRVAIRLAELGYDCAGVDLDESMLAQARARAPQLPWMSADLADLDLLAEGHRPFDLVVAAGNVVPFVTAATEPQVVARLAAHLGDGGVLVVGFGLDRSHLPPAAGLVMLEDYDRWCEAAGLTLQQRLATWDGKAYDGGGYAVSIHRRYLNTRR
jgi:2-polyprenyl-3-methyl-5-hydroxy-6-metoxy-1,4-benzoquinol methylase